MPEAPANANWYTYFPEDYRWSAAICGMISWAKWRGPGIGEIDQVGCRLAKKIGDDRHWFREWSRMGDRLRTLGRAEERKGHGLSAASHYQRACCYYQMGERFRTPKDKRLSMPTARRSIVSPASSTGPESSASNILSRGGKSSPPIWSMPRTRGGPSLRP